jgi:hypothetical protein
MSNDQPAASVQHSYLNHRPGSRKSQVHRVYNEKGAEDARRLALSLDIKPVTINGWFSTWKNRR